MSDRASEQHTADLTLNGSFDFLGQRQLLVIGANYADSDGSGYTSYTSISPGNLAVDVYHFDPTNPLYTEPASGRPSTLYPKLGLRQLSAYATLGLTPWEPLHLNLGMRFNRTESETIQQSICSTLTPCTDSSGTQYQPGQVRATVPTPRSSTHDVSWPPTVSLAYDVSPTVSVYGSYTDIYE